MIAASILLMLQFTAFLYDDLPLEEVIQPQAAADIFVDACWKGLRDPDGFHAAVKRSPLRFRPAPSEPMERWRSDKVDIWYTDKQCSMAMLFASQRDMDAYIEQISTRLDVGAPARARLAGRPGILAVWWNDKTVLDSIYRVQAEVDYPDGTSNRAGPLRADIYLGVAAPADAGSKSASMSTLQRGDSN